MGGSELVLNSFYLRSCSGLERTDFSTFWQGVVVLKELIFQQFLLWEGVVLLKELIFTVSTFVGCGDLERTDFSQFLY